MSSIYNIATYKKIFKLYRGEYNLKPYNINDTIPELITKYKINNNSTLSELSNLIGCSPSYLCNVENGSIKANNKVIKIISNLTIKNIL